MHIELLDIGKKFNREWIFKNVSHVFEKGSSTGITGSNGSGKSTLIKLISAAELPSKGTLNFNLNGSAVEHQEIYRHINFASPYMDLAEELSCEEIFDFHLKFKPLSSSLTKDAFFELLYLSDAKNKYIKNFSSGMKQRLKLGLAICFESPLLLLDEPCSNLDTKGIDTYQSLLNTYSTNRTIIIGSNEEETELFSSPKRLNILEYKE